MFRKVTRSFSRVTRSPQKMAETTIPTTADETAATEAGDGDVEIDNHNSVLVKIATLYADKLMSDICLVVGGKEYPCHRLILCASSDVFQAMLMNPQWTESSQFSVPLIETPECCEVFNDFLKYLYTGQIKLSQTTVLPILELADKYDIKDLVVISLQYMYEHVSRAGCSSHLVQWYQYTSNCQHAKVTNSLHNFLKWNLPLLVENKHFLFFTSDIFINLLLQSDLVVHNEMTLYSYAVKWLEHQMESINEEDDKEQLVIEVMSKIRFPMMTPRQLADLLLSPLTKKYKEFFVERMAIGMSFHSGHMDRIKEVVAEEDDRLLFTPRLYTADTHSTLLTVENFPQLPPYHSRTLVFNSLASLAECEGDKTCEWHVDVYPKGVWFKKFYLIVWQGTVEVPEQVMTTVRLSITCKEPPDRPSHVRVKVGILIYGLQDGIEHVMKVYEKNHYFSEEDKVLNFDDVLTFEELNKPIREQLSTQLPIKSKYLVGPNKDMLKLHIVIEPLFNIE